MTEGQGVTVISLDTMEADETVSVVRLHDGYVLVAVSSHGKWRRATVTADQALVLSKALADAARKS